MKFSMTYSGILVMFLGWLVKQLNLEIAPENLQTTVDTILVVGGGLIALYGRWRAGDLHWSGFKK